jgi:hypothetical protein
LSGRGSCKIGSQFTAPCFAAPAQPEDRVGNL